MNWAAGWASHLFWPAWWFLTVEFGCRIINPYLNRLNRWLDEKIAQQKAELQEIREKRIKMQIDMQILTGAWELN